VTIKVKINDDPAKVLLRQLQNPQAALDAIGKAFVISTQNRIKNTKQSPQGVAWGAWHLSTLLGRIKKGTASRGLLYDSGNLYNSIFYQAQGPRAANGRFQRTQVVVGVNTGMAPYAQYLQNGTPKMVARPFIGISADDQKVALAILQRHLSAQR